jgi:Secretion system C-terminal sorting domain
MKTKILLNLLFLGSIATTNAQNATLTSGNNASGAGGSTSYSIGQIAFAYNTSSGGSVAQGVQQAFEISTLGNDNIPEITLQMVVYPNPTISFVNLNIVNYELNNLQFLLYDVNGKEIYNQKITTPQTKIEIENLSKAIYFLQVSNENKLIKTFKIIKN